MILKPLPPEAGWRGVLLKKLLRYRLKNHSIVCSQTEKRITRAGLEDAETGSLLLLRFRLLYVCLTEKKGGSMKFAIVFILLAVMSVAADSVAVFPQGPTEEDVLTLTLTDESALCCWTRWTDFDGCSIENRSIFLSYCWGLAAECTECEGQGKTIEYDSVGPLSSGTYQIYSIEYLASMQGQNVGFTMDTNLAGTLIVGNAGIAEKQTQRGGGVNLGVFPSPFRSNTTIVFPCFYRNAAVDIFNEGGACVARYSGVQGQAFNWNAASMPNGVYIVRVRAQAKTHCTRLIVQR